MSIIYFVTTYYKVVCLVKFFFDFRKEFILLLLHYLCCGSLTELCGVRFSSVDLFTE